MTGLGYVMKFLWEHLDVVMTISIVLAFIEVIGTNEYK